MEVSINLNYQCCILLAKIWIGLIDFTLVFINWFISVTVDPVEKLFMRAGTESGAAKNNRIARLFF